MRNYIAWFLLMLFLVQNTVLGEFIKLPLLVKHYRQHTQLHPETTLVSFLKMHYFDKTVIDEDHEQDMQLPFKTLDNHNLIIQLSMPPVALTISDLHSLNLEKEHVNYYSSVPLGFSRQIFQPPKTA